LILTRFQLARQLFNVDLEADDGIDHPVRCSGESR
jgi:hypothetical protein